MTFMHGKFIPFDAKNIHLKNANSKGINYLLNGRVFGCSLLFTVETYCFTDGRCLFKQPQSVIHHWNQYDKEISKKCSSVRLSVCNSNKKTYSIINGRKIIRISDERAYNPLQENEAIFKKCIFFKNFRPNFRKMFLYKMPTPPS